MWEPLWELVWELAGGHFLRIEQLESDSRFKLVAFGTELRRIARIISAEYAEIILGQCGAGNARRTRWRDITDLLERGILVKDKGGGRSTGYSLNVDEG
ncbi:hypothetical protein [Oceanibaculum sp.]|uniref:hypothetical protein n=1 Tax=Oceanibaculum sp. TaxID=1903597 RepID=UPI0025901B02|nr:hypothetical protein [Oceanibaculum sp.]MCH2395813.1 hypothetical protein [Oceanibaculum sp.]